MKYRATIIGVLAEGLLFGSATFLPAGTFDWPRAWIFVGVVMVAAGLTILALPESLLRERLKGPLQKNQPLVDKIILPVFMASYAASLVFSSLDVFRYRLLPSPPLALSIVGLALYAFGWWLSAAAMMENSFATTVVRLQEERGHRLVDTGPYRVVRHPMYSGLLPMAFGAPLWLGSYAGAIASIVPCALLAIRIVFEERFLRRELPGYEEYGQRTRYRLIPGVW